MDIYKITNLTNGKIYIGCTSNFKNRVQYHKTKYNGKKEYLKPLYVAMREYGIENFEFTLLKSGLDKDEAYRVEAEMINELQTLVNENGYNVSPGVHSYNVRGFRVNTAVLEESDVKEIINRRELGEKSSTVFFLYKDRISWSGFQSIWRGKNWKHISGQEKIEIIKGNSRLSLSEVRKIKTLFKNGLTAKEVSNLCGICYHTAYNIKVGISYKSIVV